MIWCSFSIKFIVFSQPLKLQKNSIDNYWVIVILCFFLLTLPSKRRPFHIVVQKRKTLNDILYEAPFLYDCNTDTLLHIFECNIPQISQDTKSGILEPKSVKLLIARNGNWSWRKYINVQERIKNYQFGRFCFLPYPNFVTESKNNIFQSFPNVRPAGYY